MTLLNFQQVTSFMSFSFTGSNVYVPTLTSADGSVGNQFIIQSGSLQAIINAADSYIIPLIGKDVALSGFVSWEANLDSSDVISSAQTFALNYTAFMVWVTLFGGVLSNGWDYRLSELDIRRSGVMAPSARMLVEGYKLAAMQSLTILQPLSISAEGPRIEDIVSSTSPSFY